jgi:hypothetical protein
MLSLTSGDRTGDLSVWDGGEAELAMGRVLAPEILEHHENTTAKELDGLLIRLKAFVLESG